MQAGVQNTSFINWHVEVVISSQSIGKVLKPLVILTFVQTSGHKQTVVMNGEQFLEFRKQMAETLWAVHKLQKKPFIG